MLPFKSIANRHDKYRGKDCMKKIFESFRENLTEIIILKKQNEVVNKRTAGIIWYCKNLLYL